MHERPLRVFFNASAVPLRPAGAGVYTLELAAALRKEPGVQLLFAAPGHVQLPPGTTGHPALEARINAAEGLVRRLAWERFGLAGSVRAHDADVYHGPHMFVPRTSAPTVATVHDVTFLRLPGRYDRVHRGYYRHLAGTAKRAHRIIVPTGAVATDVVRFLRYPPERIRVVYEAPRAGWTGPAAAEDVAAVREKYRLEGDYLVCLGTAEPGKRAIDTIRAMPRILERVPGVTLALAGNPGRLSEALAREVQGLGLGERVRFPGYVPDEDLGGLLTGATALVFPSLFEGFGLPPLEAMACGTPVISSDAPAMREVLGDAAVFVPLQDPGAIADAATTLLESAGMREELSARGREQASRYSWAKAARETAEVYREVAL